MAICAFNFLSCFRNSFLFFPSIAIFTVSSGCGCHVTDLKGSHAYLHDSFVWTRRFPFAILFLYPNYSFSITFFQQRAICATCFDAMRISLWWCKMFSISFIRFYLFYDVFIMLLLRDYFPRPWMSSGTFARCSFWRRFTRKVHKSIEVRMNLHLGYYQQITIDWLSLFKTRDLRLMLVVFMVFFFFTLRNEPFR